MKLRDLPRFTLPASLEKLIDWGLQREGFAKSKPQPLAAAILELSRRYQDSGSKIEVWESAAHRAAYWAYFLPLNFLRLQVVVQQGLQLGFWRDVREVVDFGAGVGTTQLVLSSTIPDSASLDICAIEASPAARRAYESWVQEFRSTQRLNLVNSRQLTAPPSSQSVVVLSYSLNEVDTLPPPLFDYEKILILEPSTRQAGRRLMEVRGQLQNHGFSLWAPCTHQGSCPLLAWSKTDWCHDRILFDRPEWMMRLEQHLPLDNRSLTFSYLLASREPCAKITGLTRVIGDTQVEKGKIKQAICRSTEKEFLSWLKKDSRGQLIPRGSLIRIDETIAKKGNELRPADEFEILSSHSQ